MSPCLYWQSLQFQKIGQEGEGVWDGGGWGGGRGKGQKTFLTAPSVTTCKNDSASPVKQDKT